jgi:hypothetical protein
VFVTFVFEITLASLVGRVIPGVTLFAEADQQWIWAGLWLIWISVAGCEFHAIGFACAGDALFSMFATAALTEPVSGFFAREGQFFPIFGIIFPFPAL